MAYAAVISVLLTIKRLLNSKRISIVSSILNDAEDEVESLRRFLLSTDSFSSRKNMNELDGEMREAVSKLEDELESPLYDHLLSQSEETLGDESCSMKCFSIDEEQIQSLLEKMKDLRNRYAVELKKSFPEEDDHSVISSSVDFAERKSNIFGLSNDEISRLKQEIRERRPYELQIIAVVGESGTTRTMFAKLLCEEASQNSFETCGMVRIGKEDELKDILMSILCKMDDEYQGYGVDHNFLSEKWLGERLYTCLKGSKYLIVLDDIWELGVWNLLRSSSPRENDGRLVILTTTVMEVAQSAGNFYYELKIQIKEEMWDLIRQLEPSSYPKSDAEKIAKIQHLLSQDDNQLLGKDVTVDDDNGDYIVSTTDSAKTIAQIFELFDRVRGDIIFGNYVGSHNIICLFGMAGIGKTTLVRQIFEDPYISQHFGLQVWITMGPNYQSKSFLADFLAQIDPDINKNHLMRGDEMLIEHLSRKASGHTCFVVLDDVWCKHQLDIVRKLFDKMT